MAIIRTPRPDHYTVINNAVFSDENPLSWDAIGLLTYLLSKPDNWTVSPASLANTQRCGINKIHSLLKGLRESRFVIGKKNVNGTFDYLVYDSKQPVDQVKPPNHEKPNQAKPNQDFSRQVNTDNKQVLKEKVITEKATATAKLEIENETLKNKIAELEKKAVAAKSENKTSLPDYQKQTSDEIAQGQEWLNRFVNAKPFTPPTNPNDILLTPEQLGCFQWAINHDYWKQYAYNKSVFIKTLNKPNGGMKPQYEQWLSNQQAQKSPAAVTSSTQGSNIIPFNGQNNYDTSRQQQQHIIKETSIQRQMREGTERMQAREQLERDALRHQNDGSIVATYDSHLQPQVDFINGSIGN